jgi:hypothetical protein
MNRISWLPFVLGCFSFFYLQIVRFCTSPCFTASSPLGNVHSVTVWGSGKYDVHGRGLSIPGLGPCMRSIRKFSYCSLGMRTLIQEEEVLEPPFRLLARQI